MNKRYSPNLGGFAEKLGIKNGIYDLIKRQVPTQEKIYYSQGDINGKSPVNGFKKNTGYRYRGSRKRR